MKNSFLIKITEKGIWVEYFIYSSFDGRSVCRLVFLFMVEILKDFILVIFYI